MVVVVTTTTTTAASPPSLQLQTSLRSGISFLRRVHVSRAKRTSGSNGGANLSARAYMDSPNSFSGFANKIIGALPVIGLLARIASDEGGVGEDIVDFAEFRRRIGKRCSPSDSRAFYEFQTRRGRAGEPLYALLCCWLAAVGAGLLKSEDILEGASRLRISNDIEFEEETFLASMNEAREKRSKSKGNAPIIPMENRVEKALEAIYLCCFGKDPIEEEDERLLNIMLCAVFPSVQKTEISRIIKEKAEKIAQGGGIGVAEQNVLSKEAVEMQMKDLRFLRQQGDI